MVRGIFSMNGGGDTLVPVYLSRLGRCPGSQDQFQLTGENKCEQVDSMILSYRGMH